MQFLTSVFAALVLLPQIRADFWISESQRTYLAGENPMYWDGAQFLPVYSTCDSVTAAGGVGWRQDVSGNKAGIRIQGARSDPDVLEFNNWLGHYTIYKARDYAMYDLAGQVVGTCVPNTTQSYDCRSGGTGYWGNTMMHCTSTLRA